jgi:starvation-inducible DNA-binding protein
MQRIGRNFNQLLADTITLRDLYKKHHWQVAGRTFSVSVLERIQKW